MHTSKWIEVLYLKFYDTKQNSGFDLLYTALQHLLYFYTLTYSTKILPASPILMAAEFPFEV